MKTLLNRKKRPLTRDKGSYRDDRLFIVGTDDTYAPGQYFGFIQLPRVKVFVVPMEGNKSSARHALDRLLRYESEKDDELWMLLDTDHYINGSHRSTFLRAISDARKKGVKVAVSRPCFDLWLLLHHVDEGEVERLTNYKAIEKLLRTKLGEFNKTNLKKDHYPLEAIVLAFQRAKRLDGHVTGGDAPKSNTTRVWRLMEAIVNGSTSTQLPPALLEIQKEVVSLSASEGQNVSLSSKDDERRAEKKIRRASASPKRKVR